MTTCLGYYPKQGDLEQFAGLTGGESSKTNRTIKVLEDRFERP